MTTRKKRGKNHEGILGCVSKKTFVTPANQSSTAERAWVARGRGRKHLSDLGVLLIDRAFYPCHPVRPMSLFVPVGRVFFRGKVRPGRVEVGKFPDTNFQIPQESYCS
jgi:hypothetical protein